MTSTLTRPRIGSLFSGYGGLDAGIQAAVGGTVAWHSEIEAAPSKILAYHWPDVPNLGDVTAIKWSPDCPACGRPTRVRRSAGALHLPLAYVCSGCDAEHPLELRETQMAATGTLIAEPVDVVCGGSPCQDVSHAGKRQGMRPGTRSGLWASMCDAIDIIGPALVVWENVGGAFSAGADSAVEPCPICVGDPGDTHLRALGRVLGDLAEIGYDAAWTALRAADVGAPHGRLRVFVVAWPAAAEHPDVIGGGGWVSGVGRPVALGGGHPGGAAASADAGADPAAAGQPEGAGDGDGGGRGRSGGAPGRAEPGGLGRGRPDDGGASVAAADPGGAGLEGRGDADLAGAADDGAGGGRDLGPGVGGDVGQPRDTAASDAGGERHGRGEDPGGLGRVDREDEGGPRERERARGVVVDRGAETAPDADADGGGLSGCSERHGLSGTGREGRPGGDDPDRLGVAARGVHRPEVAWGPYEPAIRRWERVLGRVAPPPTEPGKTGQPRLSPRFCEFLMGLPEGHVTGPAIKISRNDMLKALGNGVVPQQAAEAVRRLLPYAWTD